MTTSLPRVHDHCTLKSIVTDFPGIAPGLFAMTGGVKDEWENIKFENICNREKSGEVGADP